ncbi:MAG: hypothetical protein JXR31_13395 [Prolixibacteraceae bacterium]|nr:hypothetical protein [Prolixibacteraceae bacterium]MBN2775245.1 hypothetical protein [Prolixibacteraceae bacterium]
MKTKKKSLFFIPIVIFLLFAGCQKDFDTFYYEYIGFWDSEKFVLEIWSGGEAYLLKRGRYEYYGWVDINRNRIKFQANGDDFTKRFTINQAPSIDEFGVVFMELDRKRFTLQ